MPEQTVQDIVMPEIDLQRSTPETCNNRYFPIGYQAHDTKTGDKRYKIGQASIEEGPVTIVVPEGISPGKQASEHIDTVQLPSAYDGPKSQDQEPAYPEPFFLQNLQRLLGRDHTAQHKKRIKHEKARGEQLILQGWVIPGKQPDEGRKNQDGTLIHISQQIGERRVSRQNEHEPGQAA